VLERKQCFRAAWIVLLAVMLFAAGSVLRHAYADSLVRVISTTPNNPSSIAVNPTTNKIYAADFHDGISVIDGSTNTVTSNLAVPNAADIAVDPNTDKVYTCASSGLEVIDGSTNDVLSTIPVSCDSVAVNPVTEVIYAA